MVKIAPNKTSITATGSRDDFIDSILSFIADKLARNCSRLHIIHATKWFYSNEARIKHPVIKTFDKKMKLAHGLWYNCDFPIMELTRKNFGEPVLLKYQVVPVTPFEQNCSVIWCEKTHKAAVVDPGGDLPKIEKVINEMGLTIEKILLTHAHIDHAGATADLAEKTGVPIEGPHIEDKFWIDGLPQQSQMFGFPLAKIFAPDRWLVQDDKVTVGEQELEVIHCPGHTPGHVVFYHEPSKLALVGDVLFNGSIGRTDFPKGDHNTLINSIKNKLWPLGDDVSFVPGHGPMSTFGNERRSNPFVADNV